MFRSVPINAIRIWLAALLFLFLSPQAYAGPVSVSECPEVASKTTQAQRDAAKLSATQLCMLLLNVAEERGGPTRFIDTLLGGNPLMRYPNDNDLALLQAIGVLVLGDGASVLADNEILDALAPPMGNTRGIRHDMHWGNQDDIRDDQRQLVTRELTAALAAATASVGWIDPATRLRKIREALFELDGGKWKPKDDYKKFVEDAQNAGDPFRMDAGTLVTFVNMPLRLIEDQWFVVLSKVADITRNIMISLTVVAFFMAGYGLMFGSLDPSELTKTLWQIAIMGGIFLILLNPVSYKPPHPPLPPLIKSWEAWEAEPEPEDRPSTWERMIYEPRTEPVEMPYIGVFMDRLRGWLSQEVNVSLCDYNGGNGVSTLMDCTNNGRSGRFDPGSIMVIGLKEASRMTAIPERMFKEGSWGDSAKAIPMFIMGGFFYLIIAILYIIMALMVMMVIVEGYLVLAFGMIVLCFGIVPQFRDKAWQYVWYGIGWAARIMVMMMVFFLVQEALNAVFQEVTPMSELNEQGDSVSMSFTVFMLLGITAVLTPFITTTLMMSVSNKVGGMIGGGGSEAAQTMVGLSKQVTSFALVTAAKKAATWSTKGSIGGVKGVGRGVAAGVAAAGEDASKGGIVKSAAAAAFKKAPVMPKNGGNGGGSG